MKSLPVREALAGTRLNPFLTRKNIPENKQRRSEQITFGSLHQRLLEQYAPPSLLVDEQYEILHISENAGQFLRITGGTLSQNLLYLVKEGMRLELRAALYQAKQRRMPVEVYDVPVVSSGDSEQRVNITVRPVIPESDKAIAFLLVLFEPAENKEPVGKSFISDEPVARQLEEELCTTKVATASFRRAPRTAGRGAKSKQ